VKLRPATAADADTILALNQESVAVLSPLSRERLAALDACAALHLVVEDGVRVIAFLLALREGAAYDSPNYRWFAQRYERFLYVDRVVVASTSRGHGAGALLYRAVFEFAAMHSVGLVTCEYDVEPPNPASERFHARFGFREVGRQRLDCGKRVSLQAAQVTGRASA
jgi:predicted GNAT superfamily acetyltransferase